MTVIETPLPGLVVLEARIFRDGRGHFLETWNQSRHEAAGVPREFVQDNVSVSARGVLRGLHYQHPRAQGKLVTVLRGEVFDVGVDIRAGSPTFGRWFGATLSAETGRQMYVPEGFAHGFAVTSDEAIVLYKCTQPYDPGGEGSILWSDPDLAIAWPIAEPILAPKDAAAPPLRDVARGRSPMYDGPRICQSEDQ